MNYVSHADYAFPLLPRERRFALLRLLGFEYADLGLFERSDGLRPGQLLAEPRKFARQLKRDLVQSGLRASDVFLHLGVTPEDATVNDPSLLIRSRSRKAFLLALELCTELECKHLTSLPGAVHADGTASESFALAVEEVGWRHRMALSFGICYAIRPHANSICSSVAESHFFLDAVPGLTLTLDYGHFLSQKIDIHEIRALLPYASHILVRGCGVSRLEIPANESDIDIDYVIRRLYKQKYEGFPATQYFWTGRSKCNRAYSVSEAILLLHQLETHVQPTRDRAVSPPTDIRQLGHLDGVPPQVRRLVRTSLQNKFKKSRCSINESSSVALPAQVVFAGDENPLRMDTELGAQPE
jgi:sugar phosphate isomerase/epimerase